MGNDYKDLKSSESMKQQWCEKHEIRMALWQVELFSNVENEQCSVITRIVASGMTTSQVELGFHGGPGPTMLQWIAAFQGVFCTP